MSAKTGYGTSTTQKLMTADKNQQL